MKKLLITVLCVLVFTPLITAQVKKEGNARKPATKLEAFIIEKGRLIVKKFYNIGKVKRGVYFKAVVFYELGKESQRIRGLEVAVYGAPGDSNTSLIDFEEIESLSKAIARMINLSVEWKNKDKKYTEVVFSTKDDFEIGFYQEGTKQKAFSYSGYIGRTGFTFSIEDLKSVKVIVDKGLKGLKGK